MVDLALGNSLAEEGQGQKHLKESEEAEVAGVVGEVSTAKLSFGLALLLADLAVAEEQEEERQSEGAKSHNIPEGISLGEAHGPVSWVIVVAIVVTVVAIVNLDLENKLVDTAESGHTEDDDGQDDSEDAGLGVEHIGVEVSHHVLSVVD